MYKVAFIDDGIMSGIQEEPKHVRQYVVINQEIRKKEKKHSTVCLSHGTMCFWIFSQYITNKEYVLYDIQILDKYTSRGDLKDLIKALQFCLDEEIDLINMSLGIMNYMENEGDEILQKLYARGTIIVAAQNNSNQITYPACSSYVYGVTRDYTGILKKNEFYYLDDKSEKIDIISHCDFSDIETMHGIIIDKQNSFSAPYISALIYNELQKGKNRKDIERFLKKKSVYSEKITQWEYKIKSISSWQEEITAPVIGIDANRIVSQNCFTELIRSFQKAEFCTIGIWIGESLLNNQPNIFQYPRNRCVTECDMVKIVKWVFNIARPDIIFVGHDCNTIFPFIDVMDMILTDRKQNNEKIMFISKWDIEKITELINSYFG